MRRIWTLIAAATALTLPAASVSADASDFPPRSILLFVASWCAPCHGELRQLPSIVAGAGRYRVLIVPVDKGRTTEVMLRPVPADAIWRPDAARMAAVRKELLAKTPGLPFSVTIGEDGRPCSMHRGGMTTASAQRMTAECRA